MRGLVLPTVTALLLAAPVLWRIDAELNTPAQTMGEGLAQSVATVGVNAEPRVAAISRQAQALPDHAAPAGIASRSEITSKAGLVPIERP